MIDATAVIDPRARLDSGVTVGAYSVITGPVEIDAGTRIAPHAVIQGPARIGRDNTICSFASLGEIPQDKKYRGGETELVIGDRNTIREYCSVNRGTEDGGGVTAIGDDNWIMAYVHIAHDCRIDNHTVFSNGATLAGHVVVEDYVALGGFTLIHQFCRVGMHAFTGMGCALSRDLPAYTMAAGNPARSYGINKEGLRRRGFQPEAIQALHRAYRLMIKTRTNRHGKRKEALELAAHYAEVARFIDCIDNSGRGITR